jgi:hypothetical protein
MLHTALATAPDRPMVPVAAVVAGIALTGAALVFAARALTASHEPPARHEPPAHREVAAAAARSAPPALVVAPVAAPVAAAPPAGSGPLALVFSAGGASYLSLAYLADGDGHAAALAVPPHGALRGSRGRDGVVAAVAPVDERDVPAGYQRWLGRRIEVDDVCTATVVGFAVVARQPGARGRTAAPPPGAVLRSGHAVLAARLDGCTGSYAHALPAP